MEINLSIFSFTLRRNFFIHAKFLFFPFILSCTDFANSDFNTRDLDEAINEMKENNENTTGLEILKNYHDGDLTVQPLGSGSFYSCYTRDSIDDFNGTFSDVNTRILKFSNTIQPGEYFCQHYWNNNQILFTYRVCVNRDEIHIIKFWVNLGFKFLYDARISEELAFTRTENGDIVLSNGSILRPYKDEKGLTVGFTNPDGKLFYTKDEKDYDTHFWMRNCTMRDYSDSKIVVETMYRPTDFALENLSDANRMMASRLWRDCASFQEY
jgi:hypothetical protein